MSFGSPVWAPSPLRSQLIETRVWKNALGKTHNLILKACLILMQQSYTCITAEHTKLYECIKGKKYEFSTRFSRISINEKCRHYPSHKCEHSWLGCLTSGDQRETHTAHTYGWLSAVDNVIRRPPQWAPPLYARIIEWIHVLSARAGDRYHSTRRRAWTDEKMGR